MKVNISWQIKSGEIIQLGYTCPVCKKHGVEDSAKQNRPAQFRCRCGQRLHVGTHISHYGDTVVFERIK